MPFFNRLFPYQPLLLKKEQARAELEKTGELQPKAYFFLKLPDMPNAIFYKIDISAFDINSYKDKIMLPAHFRREWIKKKAEHTGNIELLAVGVFTDTWYSSYIAKTDDIKATAEHLYNTAPMPRDDPKRKEALHVTIAWPDKVNMTAHFYERRKKGIVFTDIIEPDHYIETWMTQVYPKEA